MSCAGSGRLRDRQTGTHGQEQGWHVKVAWDYTGGVGGMVRGFDAMGIPFPELSAQPHVRRHRARPRRRRPDAQSASILNLVMTRS